jgi:hypothetical protein
MQGKEVVWGGKKSRERERGEGEGGGLNKQNPHSLTFLVRMSEGEGSLIHWIKLQVNKAQSETNINLKIQG